MSKALQRSCVVFAMLVGLPLSAWAQDQPLRVGGAIKPPAKIKDVRPAYPEEAQRAGVQGTVIIEAVVGPDGTVTDATVLRSVPMLNEAALEAVRQWKFTPTLLNGAPVSVIMTVTVNFTLDRPAVDAPTVAPRPFGEGTVAIGGSVKPPTKTKDVRPEYPEAAKAAGVSGVVILEVALDTEGKVNELRVLRSIPQLDQAAIDAVGQWEFTPTLLNGVAVPVRMTVTVNFSLSF